MTPFARQIPAASTGFFDYGRSPNDQVVDIVRRFVEGTAGDRQASRGPLPGEQTQPPQAGFCFKKRPPLLRAGLPVVTCGDILIFREGWASGLPGPDKRP